MIRGHEAKALDTNKHDDNVKKARSGGGKEMLIKKGQQEKIFFFSLIMMFSHACFSHLSSPNEIPSTCD
jgi:hypothetical protein